jgi:hypothetical protein
MLFDDICTMIHALINLVLPKSPNDHTYVLSAFTAFVIFPSSLLATPCSPWLFFSLVISPRILPFFLSSLSSLSVRCFLSSSTHAPSPATAVSGSHLHVRRYPCSSAAVNSCSGTADAKEEQSSSRGRERGVVRMRLFAGVVAGEWVAATDDDGDVEENRSGGKKRWKSEAAWSAVAFMYSTLTSIRPGLTRAGSRRS